MEDLSVDQFAAIIGIDWADKKHDVCEFDVDAQRITQAGVISSKPEAVHEWAMSLRLRESLRQKKACSV